jgi:hypothetical protein
MVPIWVNVAFNDAAADTFNVVPPAGAAAAAVDAAAELVDFELEAADEPGAELDAAELAADVLAAAVLPPEPQPAARVPTHSAAMAETATCRTRLMKTLREFQ